MYAMTIASDKSFVWQQVADPEPREGYVIIKVKAAALNRADLMQREGMYPPPPGWPEWPGLEVSGTIHQAGENSGFKVGDAVCALLGGGGYAEYVSVPAGMVLPIPEGLDFISAAGILEVFATSYLNLKIEAGMKKGDTVFIQAGASGLGLAAIQVAKFYGATVITSVGTDEKADFVRKIGADVVVNRKKQNVLDVFQVQRPDIALDCVGGPLVGQALPMMARGGRWIMVATLAGNCTEVNLRDLYKVGVRLIGSTLRSRTSEMKGEILAALKKDFWPAFSAKTVFPVIYKTFPMAQVDDAHAILQRSENTGKVILTLD